MFQSSEKFQSIIWGHGLFLVQLVVHVELPRGQVGDGDELVRNNRKLLSTMRNTLKDRSKFSRILKNRWNCALHWRLELIGSSWLFDYMRRTGVKVSRGKVQVRISC